MKKIKIMPLYNKWMASGRMNASGLCDTKINKIRVPSGRTWPRGFEEIGLVDLFEPTGPIFKKMGDKGLSMGWWASELKTDDSNKRYTFTPLRQTIVLFCAAINGEL